jgi:2-polyprenyl-3-methyl-5-hydroxy-6-metoxy-1,4-benzoquinol methylase
VTASAVGFLWVGTPGRRPARLRERASGRSLFGVVPPTCPPDSSHMQPLQQTDASAGWEAIARHFIPCAQQSTIGVSTIRRWLTSLTPSGAILDVGCGPGGPRADALHASGRQIYALDAAPTLAAAYHRRYPSAVVAVEAAETSEYFGRRFGGVLAWGLLFLLGPSVQTLLLRRLAAVLQPGGSLAFTAPSQATSWLDASTERLSVSLGHQVYAATLAEVGLQIEDTAVDDGENHYYFARHPQGSAALAD